MQEKKGSEIHSQLLNFVFGKNLRGLIRAAGRRFYN